MKRNLELRAILLSLALILAFSGAAFSQEEITAAISGQVTDSTGALVQNASVTVVNDETKAERKTTTSEDGSYTITNLTPGTYTLTIEVANFKRYVQTALILNARDRRAINVTLEAGTIGEMVTVTSQETGVLDSPTTQALVSNAQIVELPLNNRNFIRLLEAGIPGVSSDLSDETGFGLTSVASVSINGMRRNAVNYFVDGVQNTDVGSNITLLSTPTIDAIREFKVLSSNYTAEIGRSGGGAVTIVTRGGGNDFHGTLYEFVRNDRFNANAFFNNRQGRRADGSLVAAVPKLRYNNFGGTFSGPVMLPRFGEGGPTHWSGKGKTFFFFSEEVRRITRGQADASGTVPSLAQRGFNGGDFDFSSTLGLPIFRTPAGAFTTVATGNTPVMVTATNGALIQARQSQIFRASDNRAYVNNIIPRADADFRAIALLNAYPLANSPNNPNGFVFSRIDVLNTRQETIRIDHSFNQNHNLFGRYTHDLSETVEPLGLFFGAGFPGIPTSETRVPGQVFATSLTSLFSPTVVNEATFNFSSNLIASANVGRVRSSDYPGSNAIVEVFPENNQDIIPRMNTRFTLIGATQGFNIAYKNYLVRDIVTWNRGGHTFKFGGEFSWEEKGENGSNNTQGTFDFSAVQTQGLAGTAAITGTGDSFASFLLGRANAYTEAERDVILNLRFGRREFFFQDTWKIRPNLTLDFGVRYQYYVPPVDKNDIYASFDPALFNPSKVVCTTPACTAFSLAQTDPLNGIGIANRNSRFGRKINPADKNNFSPRLGIAWSPNYESGLGRFLFGESNKSVIRAGYGFYYDQPLVGIFEQAAFTSPPFSQLPSFTSTPTNVITFSNPSAGAPPGTLAPRALIAIANDFKTPETQQWSLGVQREIFRNAVLDVAYVGTRGDFLIRRRNINFQEPDDIVRVGTANAGTLRPFLGYGAITYIETSAISRYHGLLSSFNYRLSNDLTFTAAYTWSKNMTDSTNDRDAIDDPQNPFDTSTEYAEARTSRPHMFSASYVYELPWFRKSESAAKRLLLGGYQISGITNIESGAPIPRVAVSDSLAGQRGTYPNRISDPGAGLAGTIDPRTTLPFIFDPTAFSVNAIGTYGNAGRSFARLPGRNQTNLSLVKNIYFNTEKTFYLQLRAEAFNVFNHTQFVMAAGAATTFPVTGNPADTLSFARPTGTRPPREWQFAGKLYF
ncbi:MAG TPA: carboxypeptidase regulatory-like domain-containing protein [Pyrinomonadaceae bacterium]|nr:carboxypeptidase regulatory-like domain-containing protein [Pyrinomonadaceae bacterium]